MSMVRILSSQRRIKGNGAHFRHLSRRYDALRTFHGSIVDRTVEALEPLERPITLVDVGVGTDRYLLPIFRQLKQALGPFQSLPGLHDPRRRIDERACRGDHQCPR